MTPNTSSWLRTEQPQPRPKTIRRWRERGPSCGVDIPVGPPGAGWSEGQIVWQAFHPDEQQALQLLEHRDKLPAPKQEMVRLGLYLRGSLPVARDQPAEYWNPVLDTLSVRRQWPLFGDLFRPHQAIQDRARSWAERLLPEQDFTACLAQRFDEAQQAQKIQQRLEKQARSEDVEQALLTFRTPLIVMAIARCCQPLDPQVIDKLLQQRCPEALPALINNSNLDDKIHKQLDQYLEQRIRQEADTLEQVGPLPPWARGLVVRWEQGRDGPEQVWKKIETLFAEHNFPKHQDASELPRGLQMLRMTARIPENRLNGFLKNISGPEEGNWLAERHTDAPKLWQTLLTHELVGREGRGWIVHCGGWEHPEILTCLLRQSGPRLLVRICRNLPDDGFARGFRALIRADGRRATELLQAQPHRIELLPSSMLAHLLGQNLSASQQQWLIRQAGHLSSHSIDSPS